jgi:DNA-directed RNA polymerase specialized sigma24 family protein
MEREEALRRLPSAYAEALRLRGAGLDHAAIADRLELPVEAVGPLLVIAESKVSRIMCSDR